MFSYSVKMDDGENYYFEIGVVAGETFSDAVKILEEYYGSALIQITNLEFISDYSGIVSIEKNEENDKVLEAFCQKVKSEFF